MSNTVITNYTDLNGPSSKADNSVVVIVNKDGSLSVDQNLLGTLMGTDGSQSAGISVVRVGHEGRPDDATDSESEDDKIPHVTLTVDSYYDEPNSIIKYDSGAEMLQSLRIETRENSLLGFQNDHCYTPLTSPSQVAHSTTQRSSESFTTYDEPIIEISHNPPPKPVPSSKKITILEQKIIPKGKKLHINPPESPVILKGNAALSKPLPVSKSKEIKDIERELKQTQESSEEGTESSSSGESPQDRDSDSDYTDRREPSSAKSKKPKSKARILQPAALSKSRRAESKGTKQAKLTQHLVKRELKESKAQSKAPTHSKETNKNQNQNKAASQQEHDESHVDLESLLPTSKISVNNPPTPEFNKVVVKQANQPKPPKKEKKAPAHPALLTDMTALFSTPDVIRRISTDNKTPGKGETKGEKDIVPSEKQVSGTPKASETSDVKAPELKKQLQQSKLVLVKTNEGKKDKTANPADKPTKGYDLIPHLDDASLAQILQDTTGISSNTVKNIITTPASMASPGLAGPLSPTLDLLGGLQPEEDLSEDLLMHVAQLVESSENLQEVIDKQVLGKVDSMPAKASIQSPFQQAQASNLYTQTLSKTVQKSATPRKEPIEIVRRDGRVITLPPIEAPATRSSKRKSQVATETSAPTAAEVPSPMVPAPAPAPVTPEPQILQASVSKQYVNKKLLPKKQETPIKQMPVVEKMAAESQESWNSEDDPNRLWCICKQPHNNRFMICCDGCEDWFHGKCVNITKAMGQQMEEQGIEWRCPNCVKKTKTPTQKSASKGATQKRHEPESPVELPSGGKTGCIVCKKAARASSIYCSDACILKHAQDSLAPPAPAARPDADAAKQDKPKSDSRVIVYERKSGRLLAGPNAPTAENLKTWLQKNPTFEVVRPGALSSFRPGGSSKKKPSDSTPKIQTTLNFERIPRKPQEQGATPRTLAEGRERRVPPSMRDQTPQTPRTPTIIKPHTMQPADTPKPSTSTAKPIPEPRKIVRSYLNRSLSNEKPSPSPSTRRKDSAAEKSKMAAPPPELDIRENVRKSLQEQMSQRMAEKKRSKLTEEEIQQFAEETEIAMHELFRDTGVKYKAKYRSLMFNIKDRKNLTLWEKICDKSITPKQLVKLSPEELASQELAEWRDQESKHQLELIKKSELDLLAASKTYVLKTHKGEEVMETKEATELELDPNVPVEDVVIALNDSTVGEEVTREVLDEAKPKPEERETKKESRKREIRDSSSSRSKRSRRDSRRDSERKSERSRRKSDVKERRDEESSSSRRSSRRAEKEARARSSRRPSKADSKEKSNSRERSRHRSRSKDKEKKRSKSRDYSRSASKGRERSRSRRRSDSRERTRRHRSRSKHARPADTHRSRSQENYPKNKTDSTDSDSIERPKSAMLKEPHPEYDPHEPMITSAFSEEDLRKPDDGYDDTYKSEIVDTGTEYDPTKSFTLDSNIILPSTTFSPHQDKPEVESDQEPSSTVENAAATVWNGCINMVDVARFYVSAHEVSGSAADLEEELSTELDIVGRINPDTVWDYINKTKKTSNKDIVILRLQAANDEEKMQYIALYSYLSSRNRLGVVKVPSTTLVKDFYIVPLAAGAPLQPVLLPLEGPGLGEARTHLLLAVIVRQRKKRPHPHPHHQPTHLPAKVSRVSRKRSYTPPTSPRRRQLPLPAYSSTALSTSVKDKIAASLASADMDEAYSPGSSNSSGGAPASTAPAATLHSKMAELNRQIEEQKQQILKMAQADSSVNVEDDEAYSPSRPMTPPTPAVPTLADIALPSNLHEILATIKQRSSDVEMRNPPLP